MLQTERYTNEHDGREFVRVWSDAHRYVRLGEQQWEEVNEPVELARTYTEGNIIAEGEGLSAEDALAIITGGEI